VFCNFFADLSCSWCQNGGRRWREWTRQRCTDVWKSREFVTWSRLWSL